MHDRDISWIRSRILILRTFLVDATLLVEPETQRSVQEALRHTIELLDEITMQGI
jgi:hypothetical protein